MLGGIFPYCVRSQGERSDSIHSLASLSITHPSKKLTNADVGAAEDGLRRVRTDLAERRQAIFRLEAATQPKKDPSWLTNIVPNFRGDNRTCIPYSQVELNANVPSRNAQRETGDSWSRGAGVSNGA